MSILQKNAFQRDMTALLRRKNFPVIQHGQKSILYAAEPAKGGADMQKTKEQAAKKAHSLLKKLGLEEVSPTDPQGSYTGRPAKGRSPVQDADDL
jgi:hypothetical protein